MDLEKRLPSNQMRRSGKTSSHQYPFTRMNWHTNQRELCPNPGKLTTPPPVNLANRVILEAETYSPNIAHHHIFQLPDDYKWPPDQKFLGFLAHRAILNDRARFPVLGTIQPAPGEPAELQLELPNFAAIRSRAQCDCASLKCSCASSG